MYYKLPQFFDKLLTMLLLLMLPFSEAAVRRWNTKWLFLKILQTHKKSSVPEPCFNKVVDLQKEAPAQMFSSKFCKIFKNTYFVEHLGPTASAFWRRNNQNWCKKILHYINLLNKCNELVVSKCRYENKYYLSHYKSVLPY